MAEVGVTGVRVNQARPVSRPLAAAFREAGGDRLPFRTVSPTVGSTATR